jgi:hypothetical protein
VTLYRRENDFAGANIMWDTVTSSTHQLSHDMPCTQCGHAMHTFLACSDSCDCAPAHERDLARA